MSKPTIKLTCVTMPTYEVGEKNKNPMFLEKRVYQGSTGRVYPYPVIDKIHDEITDKDYKLVVLENEYIEIHIMPEIGGRICRAIDKTNDYDFVYYNQVIKPALVGLAGPWISGGIEFNWPQHHRPNTFGSVEYSLDDSQPNSVTLWVGERDRMYGTKVTTGFTLREGCSYIEISAQMYNPTDKSQTFLWWANPALKVHDDTQSIFPPDVHAVMDHGKRAVSTFPIATGEYYKYDYSKGVDISRYKNIPVPTSYMAYHSDYDFVGGYDNKKNAGLLHVANHHISPGKKQWTWGNGDFGKAWDRNLTDEDGPYIELMTGVYTDNQPDFTWLNPYEEKSFVQYFMPYKQIGEVKNANKDFIIGLDIFENTATIKVYATNKRKNVRIVLTSPFGSISDEKTDVSPTKIYEKTVEFSCNKEEMTLSIVENDKTVLSFSPPKDEILKIPEPAKAIESPENLANNEALYLAGIHLEQYRHATYEPDPYYLEGLKRDPSDMRINNAYGNLLFRRGEFEKALSHFMIAKETATRHSPNPYDGEVFFNLGKAHEALKDDDRAFDAFHKSVWSEAFKDKGFLKLAQIAFKRGNLEDALNYVKESIYNNYKNYTSRHLLATLYRINEKNDLAYDIIKESLNFDKMHLGIKYEEYVLTGRKDKRELLELFQNNPFNFIMTAELYIKLGLYDEAKRVLDLYLAENIAPYAMVKYYYGYICDLEGDDNVDNKDEVWFAASAQPPDYCFPNSILDYLVLSRAVQKNTNDAKAYYYLGCFLYDKRRYDEAKDMWLKSATIEDRFPTVHRNLALYFANKQNNLTAAQKHMTKAFELDKTDSRIFMELCELHRKIATPLSSQLELLQTHRALVDERDDLSVYYAAMLNQNGKYEEAADLLRQRQFHPWEGGEGKVPAQHVHACIALAKQILDSEPQKAVDLLEQALTYYPNFGEGKLAGIQENNVYYYLGLAYSSLNKEISEQCFKKASTGISEPSGAMYYYDQPPYMIYYQGLAFKKMGDLDSASSRFHKLISYGEKNLFEKQKMDYFAVSLPDFLVFENDLDEQNQIHCWFMIGLGHMGLDNKEKAMNAFENALSLAPNHQEILFHISDLKISN